MPSRDEEDQPWDSMWDYVLNDSALDRRQSSGLRLPSLKISMPSRRSGLEKREENQGTNRTVNEVQPSSTTNRFFFKKVLPSDTTETMPTTRNKRWFNLRKEKTEEKGGAWKPMSGALAILNAYDAQPREGTNRLFDGHEAEKTSRDKTAKKEEVAEVSKVMEAKRTKHVDPSSIVASSHDQGQVKVRLPSVRHIKTDLDRSTSTANTILQDERDDEDSRPKPNAIKGISWRRKQ